MRSVRRRTTRLAALGLGLALLVGCSQLGSSSAGKAPKPGSTTTVGAVTTSTTAGLSVEGSKASDVLRKVRLVDRDLPAGYVFNLLPQGDEVEGQVTLDVCSGEFETEAARTGRLQQVAVRGGQEVLVSNENVSYKTAVDAANALQEVRDVVASCPKSQFVEPQVAGVPPLKFDLHTIPRDLLGSVTSDHVGVEGTSTDRDGRTAPLALVFQRRGSIVVGTYARDLNTIRPFLPVVAQRLAALDPTEAGE